MVPSKKMRLNTSFQGSSREGVAKLWECPACLLIPADNIFMCSKGHSICSLCTSKRNTCSTCGVKIVASKLIRNHGLEEQLNTFKLQCRWRGCNDMHSRSDISEHEEHCAYNLNALKICNVFNRVTEGCNFQFTMVLLQDLNKVERVLEHLKTDHNIQEVKIKLGETYYGKFGFGNWKSLTQNTEQKFWNRIYFDNEIFTLEEGNKKHLFIKLVKTDMNERGQEMFAFTFVQLTPDMELENSTFSVDLCIIGSPKSANTLKWGPDCIPTTTWRIMPIKIDEFLGDYRKPVAEQLLCPFGIPISHLGELYANDDDKVKYGYTILRN